MTKHISNVYLKNKTGKAITNVIFLHRYDSDVYNYGPIKPEDKSINNEDEKLICVAEYWTGFGRIGVDYWWISFEIGNTKYTCKANFFCTLESKDGGLDVHVEVTQDKMTIKTPKTGDCSVRLYEPSYLTAQLEEELKLTGIVTEPQPSSAFKKCNCD